MKKIVALILCLAVGEMLFPGLAHAQDDYTLFRRGAGEASLLYRGHKSFDYYMLYNGTPFLETPVFRPGTVVYNSKLYSGVELNIDASRQELIVRIGKGVSNKVLGREFVEQCTIDGRRFLNLQYHMGLSAPDGYWEVLYDGRNKVLRRVKKKLEQDVDASRRDQTHYDGAYRYDVYQTFTYSADFCYLTEDGRVIPCRRRKDVLKLVDKSQRSDVRRYIRQLERTDMLPFSSYFVAVAHYLETR
jgi:hypothetical protein